VIQTWINTQVQLGVRSAIPSGRIVKIDLMVPNSAGGVLGEGICTHLTEGGC